MAIIPGPDFPTGGTIVGRRGIADAYATAFMAMDLNKTMSFLSNQKELEAYVIYLDETGETKEYMTEGFKKVVLD
jgi:thiamine biosynthesis lipoprotein